jgi:LacI family transcriptional regulator
VPRRPTIIDVARAAGVSVGTVSRVLNGSPQVSAASHERVQQAMRDIGYMPDAVAQSMRRRTTRVVGCMVNDIAHPLNAIMLGAAEARLREAGYAAVVTNAGYRPTREADLFRFFAERKVDGLLTTVSVENDAAVIAAMQAVGVPVVLWERAIPGVFDAVMTDHGGGCYQAARFLIDLGHRRIALINASDSIWPGRERTRALRQAFADCGLEPDPSLVRSHSSAVEFGFQEAYTMLTRADRPTAVIAGVNEMIGVIRAVRLLRFTVPDDLSLVSCGDTDLTALMLPALTTVRWDVAQTGRVAASLLIDRLAEPEGGPRSVVVPTEFVLRQSCAPPPR